MAYLGPLDYLFRLSYLALGWLNDLSTYLLGPLDTIWISVMTDENTNE